MKATHEWLQKHLDKPVTRGLKKLSRAIRLGDGNTISVQASKDHYCTPKRNAGPYVSVEVMFPDDDGPHGWVGVHGIVNYINTHGGINESI